MRADGSSFPPSLHFFSPFHYETGGESLLVHFPGFKDKRAGPISIIRKKRGTRKKQKELRVTQEDLLGKQQVQLLPLLLQPKIKVFHDQPELVCSFLLEESIDF
jgi:hypothetical protein